MCGIAGLIVRPHRLEEARRLLNEILNFQRFRGPDNTSTWEYRTDDWVVLLGHNRLSIIDIDVRANQPMVDSEIQHAITFNGEIYNFQDSRQNLESLGYQFRTSSDTEVLLKNFHHKRFESLQDLRGMFAFGIFDWKTHTLSLVRDRFGVKPLFYYSEKDLFAFASSVTPIAQHFHLEPNYRYLERGLRYWVYENNSSDTSFQGLECVEASEVLTVRFGESLKIARRKYYNLSHEIRARSAENENLTLDDHVDRLGELLRKSVRLRLISDVPVGISMSGGLDSSVLAAVASAEGASLHAFTYGDPKDLESEGPLAAQVAGIYGMNCHFIWPDISDVITAFDEMIHTQEMPIHLPTFLAQNLVFKLVKQHGTKVVLGGQGSDEILMGYKKFLLWNLRDEFRKLNLGGLFRESPYILMNLASELPSTRNYLQALPRYLLSSGIKPAISFAPDLVSKRGAFYKKSKWAGLNKRSVQDFEDWSLPTLLRCEDRNSMCYGVESRLPYLDYKFVEFGLGIPSKYRIQRGFGKYVLRVFADRQTKIPKEVVWARRKKGFHNAFPQWIAAGLGAHIRSLLHESKFIWNSYLAEDLSVDEVFSNISLAGNPKRIGEASCLLFLSRVRSETIHLRKSNGT